MEQTKAAPVDDASSVEKSPKQTEKTTSRKGGTDTVKTTTESTQATVEYTSSIIYLPDPSQEYTVELHSGFGSANGSLKLENGWMLTEFGGTADSKTTDVVSSLATLAGTVITAAAAAAGSAEGLYRIDVKPDGSVKLIKQQWFP